MKQNGAAQGGEQRRFQFLKPMPILWEEEEKGSNQTGHATLGFGAVAPGRRRGATAIMRGPGRRRGPIIPLNRYGSNSRCGDAGRRSGITASFEGSREEERTQQGVGPLRSEFECGGSREEERSRRDYERPGRRSGPDMSCGPGGPKLAAVPPGRRRGGTACDERPREEERVCHSVGSLTRNSRR